MILEILKDDHYKLLTECDLVDLETDGLEFIDDMIETLDDSGGIGLAANQVGILKKVIVVRRLDEFRVMINPVIVGNSNETVLFEEGCLSYLDVYLNKERFKNINVEFYCPKLGAIRRKKFNGVQSIIVQHEMDHIMGISFLKGVRVDKYE